eukprot:TRINITY_DN40159_c0_g1_i1.p1 TRINITY_DN40159_c0_g1~~TRINITY_DN40159_c0_g1_i1.p1  ORF type:complete len:430 (-),score=24.84 TRINITY_DN40159_c0_g1_i1:10-1164(-)
MLTQCPSLSFISDSIGLGCLRPRTLQAHLHQFKFRQVLGRHPLGGGLAIADVLQGDAMGTLFALGGYRLGQTCRALKFVVEDSTRSDSAKAVIFLLGGVHPRGYGQTDSVEKYDSLAGEWQSVAPMTLRRQSLAAAILNTHIYALGGHDTHQTFADAERYDPYKNSWENVASMNLPRYALCAVTTSGSLYAIGGCNDEGEPLQIIERYDSLRDSWEDFDAVRAESCVMSCEALTNSIYVLAPSGDTHSDGLVMDQYCVGTRKWKYCSSLNRVCLDVTLLTSAQRLFAFGRSSTSPQYHLELYCSEANAWEHLASSSCGGVRRSAIAFGGTIYSFGGCCFESKTVDSLTLERFSIESNAWSKVGIIPRSADFSAHAVLHYTGLPP